MWATTAAWVEKLLAPRRLSDLASRQALQSWIGKLRQEGLADASVRAYWRTLRAALSWAVDQELLTDVPRVRLTRAEKRRARSRAVTPEEFAKILQACKAVREQDYTRWQKFLKGLFYSGLRVDELRRLHWEPESDWWVMPPELTGGYPLLRILAGGQKARRDELQPVTPEFWALLQDDERKGYAFPLKDKGQMSVKRIVRTISAIGEASGVVTDPVTGKHATSHDLGRRAFLTRLDQRGLTLAEIQKWARHASIETTLAYYHHRSAQDLAAKVWGDQPS